MGDFLIVTPQLLIANLFLIYTVFCSPAEGRILALHPSIKRPMNPIAVTGVVLALFCAGALIVVVGALLDAHSKKFHTWLDKAAA